VEALRIYSPISLIDTNMAVASLNGAQKDHLFMGEQMKMAIGREVKEDDFLYFAFKLCHVGRNTNKDIFLLEEMEKDVEKPGKGTMPAWRTPIDEPIDYDHNFGFPAIVGDIYDSVLIKNPPVGEKPFIKCAGVIYRGLYPDVAFKVARGSRLGYAKVSMEVKFAHGVVGHEGRVLRGLNFKGGALTRIPADVDADIDAIPHEGGARAEANAKSTVIAVGSSKVEVPGSFLPSKK